MTPEGRVKAMVKRGLDALPSKHWRFMPVQTGYGSTALDFLICVNGRFVSIETKKDAKSKLTPLQQTTASDMVDAGAIVLTVYDQATCDRAMKIIEGICINGRRKEAAGTNVPAEAQEQADQQHLRSEQQGETVAAPTGGDHGAPRKKSRRRIEPSPRVEDQRLTAAVNRLTKADHRLPFAPPGCTCRAHNDDLGAPLIEVCAFCMSKLYWR